MTEILCPHSSNQMFGYFFALSPGEYRSFWVHARACDCRRQLGNVSLAPLSFSCFVIISILAHDTLNESLSGGQIVDKLKYLCFQIFFSAHPINFLTLKYSSERGILDIESCISNSLHLATCFGGQKRQTSHFPCFWAIHVKPKGDIFVFFNIYKYT